MGEWGEGELWAELLRERNYYHINCVHREVSTQFTLMYNEKNDNGQFHNSVLSQRGHIVLNSSLSMDGDVACARTRDLQVNLHTVRRVGYTFPIPQTMQNNNPFLHDNKQLCKSPSFVHTECLARKLSSKK